MAKRNKSNFETTQHGRFIDNTAKQISAANSREQSTDIKDSFYNLEDTPKVVTVTTTASPITFDLELTRLINFKGSANIGGARTWSFSNVPSGAEVVFDFNLTGGHAQTFPAGTKVVQSSGTLSGDKVWTPLDGGDYIAKMFYNGTNWRIQIIGPFA